MSATKLAPKPTFAKMASGAASHQKKDVEGRKKKHKAESEPRAAKDSRRGLRRGVSAIAPIDITVSACRATDNEET